MHNPTLVTSSLEAEKKEQMEKDFDKFTLSLLLAYLEFTEPVWFNGGVSKNTSANALKLHLKDLVVRANKTSSLGGGSLAILGYVK